MQLLSQNHQSPCRLHHALTVSPTLCHTCPQTVVVAADGGWKLSGFAFAVPLDGPGGTGAGGPGRAAAGGAQRGAAAAVVWPPYSYGDPFPPLWEELSKVGGGGTVAHSAHSSLAPGSTRMLAAVYTVVCCPVGSELSVRWGFRPAAAYWTAGVGLWFEPSACTALPIDRLLTAVRLQAHALRRAVAKIKMLKPQAHCWY